VTRVLQAGNALVRNASVAATELIRDAIVEGRLEPGERLKEEELARELGISRTPIREALLMLQAEDLVVATPNRGAIVRIHDAEELEDLYDLRALLEGHAARRAADRITERELVLLQRSCARFAAVEDDDLSGLVRENQFFHNAILDISGSARLASMVRKVIKLPLVYNSYRWYSPEQKKVSVDYHRRLIEAFAARDPDQAERMMREHVLEARDVLVAGVRAKQAAADEGSA
jgi:DNA-binding GntR family transcriptional regulator